MPFLADLADAIPGVKNENQLLGIIIVFVIVVIGLLAFNFGIQLTGGRHGLTADLDAGVSLSGIGEGFGATTLVSPDVARYYQQKFGSKVVTPRNLSVARAPTQLGAIEGYTTYQQPTATSTKGGAGLFSDVIAPGISSVGGARASVMARNATGKIYYHNPALTDPSAALYKH